MPAVSAMHNKSLPERTRPVIWLLAGAAIFQLLQWGVIRPLTWAGTDYGKHWLAARALLEGRSVYVGGELWLGFNYPQAVALPFVWLGWLSRPASEIVWKLLCLGFVVIAGVRAWQVFRPAEIPPDQGWRTVVARNWNLAGLLLLAFNYPLITSLYVGNISAIIGFLVVLAVVALELRHERAAGVWIALVTLIKMMPVLLVLPVLYWRRWRVLQGFLAVMAGYFVLLVLLGRVDQEWFFVREVIPRISLHWHFISIAPARGVATALGLEAWFSTPNGFDLTLKLNLLIAFGLWGWMLSRLRRRGCGLSAAAEATLLIIPLASPLLEYHHFVYLTPLMYLQLSRAIARPVSPRIGWTLLCGWGLLQSGFILWFQINSRNFLCTYWATLGYLLVLGAGYAELLARSREFTPPGCSADRVV